MEFYFGIGILKKNFFLIKNKQKEKNPPLFIAKSKISWSDFRRNLYIYQQYPWKFHFSEVFIFILMQKSSEHCVVTDLFYDNELDRGWQLIKKLGFR